MKMKPAFCDEERYLNVRTKCDRFALFPSAERFQQKGHLPNETTLGKRVKRQFLMCSYTYFLEEEVPMHARTFWTGNCLNGSALISSWKWSEKELERATVVWSPKAHTNRCSSTRKTDDCQISIGVVGTNFETYPRGNQKWDKAKRSIQWLSAISHFICVWIYCSEGVNLWYLDLPSTRKLARTWAVLLHWALRPSLSNSEFQVWRNSHRLEFCQAISRNCFPVDRAPLGSAASRLSRHGHFSRSSEQ